MQYQSSSALKKPEQISISNLSVIYLSKDQAVKITEVTSSIFEQSHSWVFQEWDLETGTQRLTRGLSQRTAKFKLKTWRKEKLEELLRSDGNAKAFLLKKWHENPSWNGEGIWECAQNCWYTTQEEAEEALEKKCKVSKHRYRVFESITGELPGHFTVA